MKKNYAIIAILVFCSSILGMNAQSVWQQVSPRSVEGKELMSRKSVPSEYQLFSLNTSALRSSLQNAPARFSGTSNVVIELPTVDGQMMNFRVYEASVMAPELQAQHPDIRSYVGQGIEDPSAIARFSVSEAGVNAQIFSGNFKTVYVDPYSKDKSFYISYSTADLPGDSSGFQCMVDDAVEYNYPLQERNADDGLLRTFRLAVATTGEYAQFHLNEQGVPSGASEAVKKAAVLMAINTTMTRVNGVYERELAVTMQLVPNNEDIIYLVASTDPFTNNSAFTLIGESQTTIDNVIGSANYDIGHTFSTGAGGLASLGVPCTANKARGVTGTSTPIGDPYDVDYVAHEMGHQYGANHTFNNSCGGNRNNGTAFEPGSGSTIMAYAGICPPNVQFNSDDYFHAISILEMWNNISLGNSQCADQTATNNDPPVADAGPDYTLPRSTPFLLKGTATDPNGDALTHSWEQFNQQIAPMPPQSSSTTGPAFRSIDPLDSPNRYMPSLNTVLDGFTQNVWEVVPSVGRTMTFRYTVRDNVAGGASSDSDTTILTFDGASGPFEITSQNGATTWTTNTSETITWDVANTDVAPVDSPNVDILFSEDGGDNFDITLALNVPNTGSATVPVPSVNTTEGRIMIISSNNIFFDINDEDVVVEGELGTNEFVFESFTIYPNPSSSIFNVSFKASSNDTVEIALYDIRGREVATNSFDTVSTGETFEAALNYGTLDTGVYFMKITNGDAIATHKIIKK